MKKTQSGRSMVEMLGVLAIIGVLSVGGLAGYSMGMSRYRVNRTINDVQLLLTNIRTLYANQTDYADLTQPGLVTMGILANDAKNLYAGEITVDPAKVTVDNDAFTVTFANVPAKACASILSSDWGTSNDGLKGITLTAGEDAELGALTTFTDAHFPISVTQAATSCGTKGVVNITWKYQ